MMKNIGAIALLLLWLFLGAWFYTCKVKCLCNEKIANSNLPLSTRDSLSDETALEQEELALNPQEEVDTYASNETEILYDEDDLDDSEAALSDDNQSFQEELELEEDLNNALSADFVAAEEERVSLPDTEASTDDSPLKFPFESYELTATPAVEGYILELKDYLDKNPSKKLLIIGHTDAQGDADYNMELGRIRAYEVRRLLINHQVPPNKISVRSEGEGQPIASNEYALGRQQNRRASIDIR